MSKLRFLVFQFYILVRLLGLRAELQGIDPEFEKEQRNQINNDLTHVAPIAERRALFDWIIEARFHLKIANDEKIRIEEQKKSDLVYKSILVVRTQIELFENELLPRNFKQTTSRYSRWVIILNSGDARAEPTLQRVLSFYNPMSKKDAIETFARALQRIYGDLSDRPHNTFSREILELLLNDNKARKQLLDELKIPTAEIYTKALEVIAVELKSSLQKDEKADDSHGLNNLKCITIFPDKTRFKDGKDEDDDVYKFFPTTKPNKVVFKKGKGKFADSFTVHFDNTFASVDAIDNNLGWLRGQKVILKLHQCSDQ